MTKEEKLNKVVQDFSSLPEEKQNYVLGVLQALVFANIEGAGAFETDHRTPLDGTGKKQIKKRI
jgi:hypothetical protein